MQPFLILTVLMLAFTISKAQNIDKRSKEFIIDFYKDYNDVNKPFIYIKRIYQSEIYEIIKALNSNDTFKNGVFYTISYKLFKMQFLKIITRQQKILTSN